MRTPKRPHADDAPALKGLDTMIGYHLRLAYNMQVQRFATIGGSFNIRPPQFAILAILHHNPRLKQTELTKALNKKHANIVTLLDELQGRNLLSRTTDADDKRSRVLDLTPAGQKLAAKLIARQALLDRDLRRAFGSERLDRLYELLDAFRRLDPEPTIDEPQS